MANIGEKATVSEKILNGMNGMAILVLNILLCLASIGIIIYVGVNFEDFEQGTLIAIIVSTSVYLSVVAPILFMGIKVIRPQEAKVLTLFGKYHGTLKTNGMFFVNPFAVSFAPKVDNPSGAEVNLSTSAASSLGISTISFGNKKVSLKVKTLNNDKQKINDLLGNPIIVDTMVVWRVVETAKAVFAVDNYVEFVSMQCDSALRGIVSLYPYDAEDDNKKCLRSSSAEIAERLKEEIQEKVVGAGLEIIEAKITNLFYAPEIATAMLQRQQAAAVVDAKQTIVEGAVDIVEMALKRLSDNGVVHLDEERKAAMVSNLLVVLCSGSEAQPVVNSGSLY